MEIKLDNVTQLLKILSWRKIIQLAVFLLVCGVAYGFWENRIVIYNTLKVGAKVESDEPMRINLSTGTLLYLNDSVVKSKDFIAGIQIINVDFKKNIRSTSHFTFGDQRLRGDYEKYQALRIAPLPLFTSVENANQKIINLINGEFTCDDFEKTVSAGTMPGAADYVSKVCAISIPPYYGRFSGYMNVYLLKNPSQAELAIIRQLSRDISLKIYENDISKKMILQGN